MTPVALLEFVHTSLFDASMAAIPMSDATLADLQAALCANPTAGDIVGGLGGARKVRVGVRGRGKRGGARVIYFYRAESGRIYLLLAYGKHETDDLSPAGKKALREMLRQLE